MQFAGLPDYHRSIDRRIIDPPFAAFEWTITGTWKGGVPAKVKGCSIVESDEERRLRRGMVFVDNTQLPSSGG